MPSTSSSGWWRFTTRCCSWLPRVSRKLASLLPALKPFIASPQWPLLKRFRNAVFHYQDDFPISDKLKDFIEAKDSEKWIKDLFRVLNVWFSKQVTIPSMKRFVTRFRSGDLQARDEDDQYFLSSLSKAFEAMKMVKP